MSGFKTRTPWALFKSMIADRSGMSSIETAVIFGVFAVVFALIATPFVDNASMRVARNDAVFGQQVDNVITGSIAKSRQFRIRKSILQPSKTSQCIIYSDGRKYGDCN